MIPADESAYSGHLGAGYAGYGYGSGYAGLGAGYGSLGYARGYAGYGGIGAGYYGAPTLSQVSVYRVHEDTPASAYAHGGQGYSGYGNKLAW